MDVFSSGPSSSSSWYTSLFEATFTPWISSVIATYLIAVRALRYRRVRALERDYAKIKSNLSPAQAQKIIRVPLFLDLPYLSLRSQQFALFKTYGIVRSKMIRAVKVDASKCAENHAVPKRYTSKRQFSLIYVSSHANTDKNVQPTISRQLNQTKQLAKKETISKRYVDTAVLISTWISSPISGPGSGVDNADGEVDPRSAIAVARVNWLHSHYKISNDDFLYTLSVFIYEPIRWTERYGWRHFTRLECEALYIFWAEIGRRMGIEHIPSSYNEFKEWSEDYERNHMVPDENNALVAEHTIGLLLHKVPHAFGLKSFGRRIVICLLDQRLREAMMLPEQPAILISIIRRLLHLHGFFCRHFCLPRIKPNYFTHPDAQPKFTTKSREEAQRARGHPEYYDNDPWYSPESGGLRKFLENIQVAVGLAKHEDFPGPHFLSEGYRLEELGPMSASKSGHEKVMEMAEAIQGAPVKGPWSLYYAGGCPMGANS